MLRRLFSRYMLLIAVVLFTIPALACDFSFNLGGESTSTPSAQQRASVIKIVTMAKDTQGAEKEPANPTTVFQADSVFHAVVAIQDAPAGTTFKAAWYVTNVGDAAAPNTLIDATELTTSGTRNID